LPRWPAGFVGRSRRVHGAAAPSRFEKHEECPEMAVESPSAATPCGGARGELDLLPTADATTCPASRASSSLSVDVRFITSTLFAYQARVVLCDFS